MRTAFYFIIGLMAAQSTVADDRYSAQQRAMEAGERSRELSRQSQQRAMAAGERSRELSRQSQQRAMEAGERSRELSRQSQQRAMAAGERIRAQQHNGHFQGGYSQPGFSESFTVAAQSSPGRSRFIIIDGQRYEEIDGPLLSDGEELPRPGRPEVIAIQPGPREVIPQYPGLITVTLPYKNAQLYVNGALIPGEGEKRSVSFPFVKKGETVKAELKVVAEKDGKRITGEAEVDVPYGRPKEYRLNLDKARVEDLFLVGLKAKRTAEEKSFSDWFAKGQKELAAKKTQLAQNKEAAENLVAARVDAQNDPILKTRLLENITQESAKRLEQLNAVENEFEAETKTMKELVPAFAKTAEAEYVKNGLAAIDGLNHEIQKMLAEGHKSRSAVDAKRTSMKVEAVFPTAEFIQKEVKVRTYEMGTMGKWKADQQQSVREWAMEIKRTVDALTTEIANWVMLSQPAVNAITDEVLKARVQALLEEEKRARLAENENVIPVLAAEENKRNMRIDATFDTFVSAHRAGEDMNEVQKRYTESQPKELERTKLANEEIARHVTSATTRQREGVSMSKMVELESKVRTYERSLNAEMENEWITVDKWFSNQMKDRDRNLVNWSDAETIGLDGIKFALIKSGVERVFREESKNRTAFEQLRKKMLENERDRRKRFADSYMNKMVREFRETGDDAKMRAELAEGIKAALVEQQAVDDSLKQRDEAELRRSGKYPGIKALEKVERAIYPIPHHLAEGCGAYSLTLEMTGAFAIYHEKIKGKLTKVAEFAKDDLKDAVCIEGALAIIASKMSLPADQPTKEYTSRLWLAIFDQGVLVFATEPELKRAKFERVWVDSIANKFIVTAVEDNDRFTLAVSIDGKDLDQIDNREAPARTKGFMGRLGQ